jgi:hypothetical protein
MSETEQTDSCEFGKKYPCCNCKDPCPPETKRRTFYDPFDEENEPDLGDEEEDPNEEEFL